VKAAGGGTGGEAVAVWVGLERARRGWARRAGVTESEGDSRVRWGPLEIAQL
jgi:hypothetical protein